MKIFRCIQLAVFRATTNKGRKLRTYLDDPAWTPSSLVPSLRTADVENPLEPDTPPLNPPPFPRRLLEVKKSPLEKGYLEMRYGRLGKLMSADVANSALVSSMMVLHGSASPLE